MSTVLYPICLNLLEALNVGCEMLVNEQAWDVIFLTPSSCLDQLVSIALFKIWAYLSISQSTGKVLNLMGLWCALFVE